MPTVLFHRLSLQGGRRKYKWRKLKPPKNCDCYLCNKKIVYNSFIVLVVNSDDCGFTCSLIFPFPYAQKKVNRKRVYFNVSYQNLSGSISCKISVRASSEVNNKILYVLQRNHIMTIMVVLSSINWWKVILTKQMPFVMSPYRIKKTATCACVSFYN